MSFCVYGKKFNVEIDTGIRCNIIDTATVANLKVEQRISASKRVIKGVHGEYVKPIGCVVLP